MNKYKYCAFAGLGIIVLTLAAATGMEKVYGNDFVHAHIYGAWWFVALWGVAAVSAVAYIACRGKACLALFRTPSKFHWYCVLAFVTVAMTFFGVTYLLGGMHSYVS